MSDAVPHDNAPPGEADADEPLSKILRTLAADPDEHISLGDAIERFGRRALGAVLFLLGLINLIPWPPGGTTITGTPLLLVAAQVAFGARKLWLPKSITRRGLNGPVFRSGLNRILPWLERIEKVSRPRLHFLFGSVGDRVLGLVCTLLAAIIVLPIFGGNFLPALAVSVLALSLVQKDGVLALIGYALVAAAGTLLIVLADLIIDQVQKLLARV